MPIKAKRLASKKGIKASLTSTGGKYAQRVPDEGIELRFLEEPEEWFAVELHYGDKDAYPCVGIDDGCIGCEEGVNTGKKWYASAYWPEEDRVVVFEMGKTVMEAILKKYERNNTVQDRNFEITKEGTGMQTRYFVESLDAQRIKGQDQMEPIDLEKFFDDWLTRFHNESGAEEVISTKGRRRTASSASKRRRAVAEEDDIEDEEDEEDDVPESKPVRRRPKKSTGTKTGATKRRRPRA